MSYSRFNLLPLAIAALAVPASAQTVANSFEVQPVGSAFVGGLAYDSTTDHIWVADSTSDLISEYDRNGVLIQSIAAGSTTVIGVAVDPASNSLWVADENENCYEYDRTTGLATGFSFSVTAAITDLSSAAFDTDTGTLWFSQDSGVRVAAEFDTAGTLLQTIDLTGAGAIDPDGLAFNTVTNTLFLGEDTGDRVLEVDLSGNLLNSWTVTDPVWGIVSPEGLGIDTVNGKLYIGDGFITRRVYEVDGIVAAGPAGPSLSLNCGVPGQVTADFTNFTAGGPIAVAYGAASSYTHSGNICNGIMLDLTPAAQPVVLFADGAGNASLTRPTGACGSGALVQAADLATCTASNSAAL